MENAIFDSRTELGQVFDTVIVLSFIPGQAHHRTHLLMFWQYNIYARSAALPPVISEALCAFASSHMRSRATSETASKT